jgi:hypothetical protein
VASLVDTNILVYSFDPRDPVKQRRADEILREGLLAGSLILADGIHGLPALYETEALQPALAARSSNALTQRLSHSKRARPNKKIGKTKGETRRTS